MRRRYGVVLDEHLDGATNANPAWTDAELDIPLGAFDQLALQAVVDDMDASGGNLIVQIYHSADGINYVPKAGSPEVVVPSSGSLDATTTETSWGADLTEPPDGNPSLGMVRLRVWFTGTTTAGHVRIHATQRDVG